MTHQPPTGRGPSSVEVARVRGGISPRVGAVAVAGVLAAVVWIGISGRPAPTAPASERPGVAQVPTERPSATADAEATVTPIRPVSPSPGSTRAPPRGASIEADDLSIVATIGNRQFMTWLRPAEHGHLSGTFRLPIPPPATEGTLELARVWRTVAQIWRTASHDAWATVSTWDLRLESLSAASGRQYLVLDQAMPARPSLRDISPLLTRGYRITVRAKSGVPSGLMSVDIQIAAGHQLEGNDGIFGWPVVGQIQRQTIPRGRGLYNRCRWDVSPMSGTPRSGDESGC